jgi:hypothetical protein
MKDRQRNILAGIATVVLGGVLFAPSMVVAEELAFEDGGAVITGEVLKPEITVVMSRENLNKSYDLTLKESFLQKIIDSVEQPPF